MTIAPESVTQAGSGLVFINYYDANVSDAYRSAIVAAEHELQSHFTNSVTVGVSFGFKSLGAKFAAQNSFDTVSVSYDAYVTALRLHAMSADDQLAVNGLPAVDPSNGVGFAIPTSEARILGLAVQTNSLDVTVTLNSDLAWSFGQDAIGAIEHEITEGAFGRIGSLGIQATQWAPLDLFRFNAQGVRDFTGGSDGVPTFFGLDANHLTSLAFHNSVDTAGKDDGFDLGDWDHTFGDAFGAGGPNSPGSLSATDLQVLDILGWNSAAFTPAPDDFASSVSDITPFGHVTLNGSATGALQQAGDHDFFVVSLQQGVTYTINLVGHFGGGGTLADPFLRLHDSTGLSIVSNDDIVDGSQPDSRIVFTAPSSGTYYIDAGAFADGYAGSYTVEFSQAGSAQQDVATSGDDVLFGKSGGDTIDALAGADTITGADGSNFLRGNDGNDSITSGTGFNDINGNKGEDTIIGHSLVGEWLVGGQGNDSIASHADNNILYGNLGDDTLVGAGSGEIIRGGQGDDSMVAGSGAEFLSGDRGSDTIQGGAGADTFHTFSGAGIDIVLGFSAAKGDHVLLDAGTNFTLSQVGADTVIDMGGGDEMILRNVQLSSLPDGWIFTAAG